MAMGKRAGKREIATSSRADDMGVLIGTCDRKLKCL